MPVTGKIGRAAYSVGNLVGPDSGVLATIVSQDPMYVTFPVSAALILEVQRESPTGELDPSGVVVRLRLPDGSTYAHPGRIDFLSNQVDRGTDTLTARAVVPNPERVLVDGQFVNVRAEDAARPETALVVPQAAVQYDQAGSYVLVVGADGTVEARRVALGAAAGHRDRGPRRPAGGRAGRRRGHPEGAAGDAGRGQRDPAGGARRRRRRPSGGARRRRAAAAGGRCRRRGPTPAPSGGGRAGSGR